MNVSFNLQRTQHPKNNNHPWSLTMKSKVCSKVLCKQMSISLMYPHWRLNKIFLWYMLAKWSRIFCWYYLCLKQSNEQLDTEWLQDDHIWSFLSHVIGWYKWSHPTATRARQGCLVQWVFTDHRFVNELLIEVKYMCTDYCYGDAQISAFMAN